MVVTIIPLLFPTLYGKRDIFTRSPLLWVFYALSFNCYHVHLRCLWYLCTCNRLSVAMSLFYISPDSCLVAILCSNITVDLYITLWYKVNSDDTIYRLNIWNPILIDKLCGYADDIVFIIKDTTSTLKNLFKTYHQFCWIYFTLSLSLLNLLVSPSSNILLEHSNTLLLYLV